MVVLEGVAGPAQGLVFALQSPCVTIGKRATNDLVFDDPTLSRVHARIEQRGGPQSPGRVGKLPYHIVDVQSTNGTRLNGLLVREAPLTGGDQITVGASVLRVRNEGSVALIEGGAPPPVAQTVLMRPGSGVRPLPSQAPADLHQALEALGALAREGLLRTDLRTALGRVLDVVFEVLPVERGALVLLEPDGFTPREAVLRRRGGGEWTEGDMPLSRGLARQVLERREAVLVPDACVDPVLAQRSSIIQRGIRCAAYAPLLRDDGVFGLLCVDTPVPGGLSPEHLELLVAFAGQAAVNIDSIELQDRVLREQRRRESLQRYVAPHIADRIVSSGGGLPQSGESELTVLFADLDGFTTLAEQLPPSEVQALLSGILSRLTAVAFRYGGAVDKYIGDCVMVLWGTPGEDDHHALRAVVAAEAMVRDLQEFQRSFDARYGDLGLAVGLNTGRAFVGDMGCASIVQYTAIGHVVNVASRLQGLAERNQILAGSSTVECCGEAIRSELRGRQVLRGTAGEVDVFEVLGLADENLRLSMEQTPGASAA